MYRLTFRIVLILIVISHQGALAGQDPMRPPSWFGKKTVEPKAVEELELQQILISKDRKLAIVNNRILREGEMVLGAKILLIETNKVRIRRAGIEENILLLPKSKEVNSEI